MAKGFISSVLDFLNLSPTEGLIRDIHYLRESQNQHQLQHNQDLADLKRKLLEFEKNSKESKRLSQLLTRHEKERRRLRIKHSKMTALCDREMLSLELRQERELTEFNHKLQVETVNEMSSVNVSIDTSETSSVANLNIESTEFENPSFENPPLSTFLKSRVQSHWVASGSGTFSKLLSVNETNPKETFPEVATPAS